MFAHEIADITEESASQDARDPMSNWGLEGLLHPFDRQMFLSDVLSRSFLHVSGPPEKFARLFSWPSLNRILSATSICSPQLRVTRGNTEEPPASLFHDVNGISVIRLSELNRILREGTLLTIDSLEEVDVEVAELCLEVETTIGLPILQVQMHATFSAAPGPGLRCNDHDMIVLQIAGSKAWTLYGHANARRGPTDPPVWSETVRAGDLLYVPRNWQYVENAFDTSALHLAIAFRNPTGIEIAARVIENLTESEFMCMDYPRFGNEQVRAGYLTELQMEIVRAFEGPDVIRGYFNDVKTLSRPRRLASLPWSLIDVGALPGKCRIAPAVRFAARDLRVRIAGSDLIEIRHDGGAVRVSDKTEAALQAIFDEGGGGAVEDLLDKCGPEISRDTLVQSLNDLIRLGAAVPIMPPECV